MKIKHMVRQFDIKEINNDGTFEGYGSVFNVVDHSKDVVIPGAFEKSLENWKSRKMMPPILWQHDSRNPIGVYEKMEEDSVGLFVQGRLLVGEVNQAKEAHALMKAGALSGLSIGYRTIVDEFDRETGINTLKELELWEVSPVTFPDNDFARITDVKSIITERDFENFLRESGFSRSEAVRIASTGFERRDSAKENAEIEKLIRKNFELLKR